MYFIKKHNTILLSLLFIFIVACYMKLNISGDEIFTMNLVNNSYHHLITNDIMDVHPPLYYIILKFFLNIVLFYKHTLISEIIIARLFSIICSVVTFVFLVKISKKINIFISIKLQSVLFLVLPNLLGIYNFNNQAMDLQPMLSIRMYALATMFFVIMAYFIIRFNDNNKIIYLIIAVLMGDLAAYTHYFSALMAGLLLLFYFFYYLFYKNKMNSFKLLLGGLFFLVIYVPWIIYGALDQVKNVSGGFWIGRKFLILNSFEIFILIILFYIPFRLILGDNNIKNKNFVVILFFLNLATILIALIMSITSTPVLLLRYMYPSLMLYEFICFTYLVKFATKNRKFIIFFKFSLIFIVFLFSCSFLNEIFTQIPKSINMYSQLQKTNVKNLDKPNSEESSIDFSMKVMYMVSKKEKLYVNYNVKSKLLGSNYDVWRYTYKYMDPYIFNKKE